MFVVRNVYSIGVGGVELLLLSLFTIITTVFVAISSRAISTGNPKSAINIDPIMPAPSKIKLLIDRFIELLDFMRFHNYFEKVSVHITFSSNFQFLTYYISHGV